MNIVLLFRKSDDTSFSIERVFDSIFLQNPENLNISKISLPNRKMSFSGMIDNLRFIYGLRKRKNLIFHVTGDVHYAAIFLPGRRTVLTIHDCVFMDNKKGIKRVIMKLFWLKLPVMAAGFVTAISEKTKKEILEHINCNPDKIVVINNPVSDNFTFTERIFNSTCPEILFLGTKANKNLQLAIAALHNLPCCLIIVGILAESDITTLKLYDIKYSNYFNLNDLEIVELYKKCDLVLFPSIYEGFGMPVIEAQKVGRPVIASNIAPINLIAGEGACLIDPSSSKSIRSGLDRVIQDDEYRDQIVKKGFENVERFSSGTIYQQYLNVYQQLIKKISF